ncbi:MAG TPA: hypothetical protein VMV77_05855 [Bacteroidales bacterium]|nr:hypothetical protein [Bacteroidales bacterium]
MKNLTVLLILAGCLYISSCKKDTQSERFKLLTGPVWVSDSLLANSVDAGSVGGLLEDFKGDVKFNEDGTGSFGVFTGTWKFAWDETQIVIATVSLPIPLTTNIAELTNISLKITTSYPNPINLTVPINIRMTFKAK